MSSSRKSLIHRLFKYYTEYGFNQTVTASYLTLIKKMKIDILILMWIHRKQEINFRQNIDTNLKNLIIVLIPPENVVSGGVMSMFSIAKFSREFYHIHKSEVILATIHIRNSIRYDHNGRPIVDILIEDIRQTYLKQTHFSNEEKIYRFDQIVSLRKLENLMIFLPEYAAKDFYTTMPLNIKKYISSLPNTKINIMNQHIDFMPKVEKMMDLYKITDKITQTCAHPSYVSQEIANQYYLPTLYLSAYFEEFFSLIDKKSFKEKDNVILYSPDDNEHKQSVLAILQKDLPEFKLKEIRNISFIKYMQLISKAKFVITFGEGMDGYLVQPFFQGSISFAVYNEEFFPSKEYTKYFNIFESYDDMKKNIVNVIKKLNSNEKLYDQNALDFFEKIDSVSDLNQFLVTLERLYHNDFDFYPEIRKQKSK